MLSRHGCGIEAFEADKGIHLNWSCSVWFGHKLLRDGDRIATCINYCEATYRLLFRRIKSPSHKIFSSFAFTCSEIVTTSTFQLQTSAFTTRVIFPLNASWRGHATVSMLGVRFRYIAVVGAYHWQFTEPSNVLGITNASCGKTYH